MSIRELFSRNYFTLHAKKIIVDELEVPVIIADNVIATNATVTNLDATNATGTTLNYNNVNGQNGNFNTVNAQTINGLNITTDNLSSQTFTSDTATINDLTINNSIIVPSITTPTINCDNLNVSNNIVTQDQTINGTLTCNDANIDTLSGTDISYVNANFNTLTSPNANIDTITGTNITYVNGTLNDLTVNTTLTAPTITSNNITSITGNISDLTSSTINCLDLNATNSITSTVANLDTISGTNLTYTNGNIDQLNGGNVQYGTGNIGDITGTNLTYDVGYIPTLSTKELTIYSSIVSCPSANIDNLTVNSSFTAPLFEAPEMHVDYVRSYSVGKTTFQENVVVDTQFNCPVVSADVIQTNGSGNVIFINPIIGTDETLTGTITVPSTRTNSLSTTTGSGNITSSNPITCANINTNVINSTTGGGFINVQRPLVLPNITNSTALAYYSYSVLSLTTSGCISTTIGGFGVRVGNMITVYIQCFPNTTLATSLGILFINGFPSGFNPNVGSTRGTCLVNSPTGTVVGSYTFTSSGQLNVFSSPNGGGWSIGQPCGFSSTAVVGNDYATISLITNV